MPTLYVVATPIGNLEDVTLRALRILGEVSLIAAEDTRVARKLLDRYGIFAKLTSYTDHNKRQRIPELLAALSQSDVALITDAGTPAISDPGAELVAAARAAGHAVVPVPGASAVVAALSVAGFPSPGFRFLGFLPRQQGPLRALFESLQHVTETLVAFESPNRLPRTLRLLAEVLGGRTVAVCRELTKVYEEVFVGTAAEAAARFQEVRGEVVLVVEGAAAPPAAGQDALRAEVALMRSLGLTRAQAAALLERRHHATRRQVYRLWLESETR